jgi:hypothetical protein
MSRIFSAMKKNCKRNMVVLNEWKGILKMLGGVKYESVE